VQHVSRPLVTIFDSPLICTASCAQALLMLDVPEQQAAGHHFIETVQPKENLQETRGTKKRLHTELSFNLEQAEFSLI